MDKYDLVLDITAHPERYSDSQLAELLADAETREIYNLLCDTRSALESTREMTAENVADEWERFRETRNLPQIISQPRRRPRLLSWAGSRVAVITAVMVTSLGSVAVGIGINLNHKSNQKSNDAAGGTEPIVEMTDPNRTINDSAAVTKEPILFENATLETILQEIGARYSVKVRFNDDASRKLRLYYRYNPSFSVEEVVSHLNNFDRINLTLDGGTLNVD